MTTRFKILGPLEAWQDRRLLELGRPRQRAVLASLLVTPNYAVSLDELVEHSPAEPRPAGRSTPSYCYVSSLRRISSGSPPWSRDGSSNGGVPVICSRGTGTGRRVGVRAGSPQRTEPGRRTAVRGGGRGSAVRTRAVACGAVSGVRRVPALCRGGGPARELYVIGIETSARQSCNRRRHRRRGRGIEHAGGPGSRHGSG